MKLKIEADKEPLADGMHKGVITAIEYREKPYEYTDVIIEYEENRTIKAGFPTFICPTSKLGLILTEFGADLQVGQDIEPETVLIGKECEFMVLNKKTDKGTYPNVVQGSLKCL